MNDNVNSRIIPKPKEERYHNIYNVMGINISNYKLSNNIVQIFSKVL